MNDLGNLGYSLLLIDYVFYLFVLNTYIFQI